MECADVSSIAKGKKKDEEAFYNKTHISKVCIVLQKPSVKQFM